MPDPLTAALLTSLASALAYDATKWLMAQANETALARQVRQKVGLNRVHPKAQKTFRRAAEEASRELPHLHDEIVEAFFDAGDNRRIVSQWIWEPSRAEMQKERLDRSAAITRQEQSNLEHFINRLPEVLELQAREVFEDEAWVVIERVSSTARREGGKTRSALKSTHDDLADRIEQEGARNRKHTETQVVDRLDQILTQMSASGGASDRSAIESALLEDLDEVKGRIDNHRIEQAISLGRRALEKIEKEDLSPEARRTAHEHLANAFLSTLDRREEALPHVDALAALAENRLARLRNQALAAHLRGETERGLELVDKALAEDPEDRTARHVKVNLLAEAGREDEAADLEAEHVDIESPDDLHNLGMMEIRAGRFDAALGRAQSGLEIAPDRPDLQLLFGMAAVLGRNTRIEYGETPLGEEEIRRLQKACAHLERAADGYAGNPSRQAAAHFYQGVIDIWFGRLEQAERAFEQTYRLTPSDGPTLHNLTLLALRRGDGKSARRYFERLNVSSHAVGRAEQLQMKSRILQLEGRGEEALSLLEEALQDDLDEEVGVEVRLLLAGAYRDELESEKADALLGKLREKHPGDPRLLTEEALLAGIRNEYDVAIGKLREALRSAHGKRAALAESLLANALYARAEDSRAEDAGSESDYEEALALYRKRLHGHPFSETVAREAMCLLRLGRYRECMELCEAHLEEDPDPQLAINLRKIQARLYEIHEDFSQAAELYKEVALKSGGDINALLRCSQCYALVGEASRARGAVEKVTGQIALDSPHAQLIASKAYLISRDMKKAVHPAYLAQKHGGDDRGYVDYYISLFLFHSNTIEREGAAEQKHWAAYQRLVAEYPERFPDSPFFQPLEKPEDPEELRAQLLEQLPSVEEIQAKQELLASKPLPVGAVATLLGRSVAEAWALLVGTPEYEISADEGPRDLLQREIEVATSAEAVMLDVVPLLTLDELGLLAVLSDAFEEIYVPQAAFDELQGTIAQERSTEGKERQYLRPTGEDGGGLTLTRIPAENRDAFLVRLRRVRNFIRDRENVTLVGKTVGREQAARAKEQALSTSEAADGEEEPEPGWDYEQVLGRPAAEALQEAPLRGLTLYAEDAMVRRLARSEGTKAFGTRALLAALQGKGKIPAWTFHLAMVRLVEMGCSFPFIHPATLKFIIEREGGLTGRVRAALGALADPRSDLGPVFYITASLIYWFWATYREPTFGEEPLYARPIAWTWRILSVVARGDDRRGLALVLERAFRQGETVITEAIGRTRHILMVQAIRWWREQQDSV